MTGTIKIDGEELTIANNGSADIALASFSGYVSLVPKLQLWDAYKRTNNTIKPIKKRA